MKKFSEWFLSQRQGAKVGLILLTLVVLIGGLVTLVNLLNPTGEVEPDPTTITVPEPEPTETIAPEDNPDGGVNDDPNIVEPIPDEDDEAYLVEIPEGAPYDDVKLAELYLTFAPDAAMAECTYTFGETVEARGERLAPYFPVDSKQYSTAPSPIVENQICSIISQKVMSIERDTFKVKVAVRLNTLTTFTMTEQGEKKTAQQGLKEFVYDVNYIDGKWIVVS